MSDIERLCGELRNSTKKIFSNMVMEFMVNVDEGRLVSKKQEFWAEGINLTADRRIKKKSSRWAGKLSFMRINLRPTDRESRKRLFSSYGIKSVVPLYIYLGIDTPPCKMSIDMMLKCSF